MLFKEKEMILALPPIVIYGVALTYNNYRVSITRNSETLKIGIFFFLFSSKGEHLKRHRVVGLHPVSPKDSPLGSHMDWLKYMGHPKRPIWLDGPWWYMVHRKSCIRYITYPSTIPAVLVGLTSKFHGIWPNAWGLSHHFMPFCVGLVHDHGTYCAFKIYRCSFR